MPKFAFIIACRLITPTFPQKLHTRANIGIKKANFLVRICLLLYSVFQIFLFSQIALNIVYYLSRHNYSTSFHKSLNKGKHSPKIAIITPLSHHIFWCFLFFWKQFYVDISLHQSLYTTNGSANFKAKGLFYGYF